MTTAMSDREQDLVAAVRDLIKRVLALEARQSDVQKDQEGVTNAVLYLAHQLDEIYRVAAEIEAEDSRDDLEARRRRGRQTARDLAAAVKRH